MSSPFPLNLPPRGKLLLTVRVTRPDGRSAEHSLLVRDDLDGMPWPDSEQSALLLNAGAAITDAYLRAARLSPA